MQAVKDKKPRSQEAKKKSPATFAVLMFFALRFLIGVCLVMHSLSVKRALCWILAAETLKASEMLGKNSDSQVTTVLSSRELREWLAREISFMAWGLGSGLWRKSMATPLDQERLGKSS